MTEVQKAVLTFRNEIESIESLDIKTFVQNALNLTKPSFYEDEEVVNHTKKVFKIVKEFLDTEGTKGALRDLMLVAVLLSDIALNELPENLKHLHPLVAKDYFKEIQSDLQKPVIEGIIDIIESHEGSNAPTKALDPRPGQPGFIIALANKIARFDFVDVHL